jgi:hypothetical protein
VSKTDWTTPDLLIRDLEDDELQGKASAEAHGRGIRAA